MSASGVIKAAVRGANPIVTLGQTEVWEVEKALENETGQKWTPPLGEAKFWLVRLACTLRNPSGSAEITAATQSLYLRPVPASAGEGRVYAYRLFPQRVSVDEKSSTSLKLDPELGFADGSKVKVGEAGLTIEHSNVFPVIQAYDEGTAAPSWQFAPHASHPLTGSQFVYAILVARAPATGLRAHVELTVTTQSAFGPVKYGTPQAARQHTEFSLG